MGHQTLQNHKKLYSCLHMALEIAGGTRELAKLTAKALHLSSIVQRYRSQIPK